MAQSDYVAELERQLKEIEMRLADLYKRLKEHKEETTPLDKS